MSHTQPVMTLYDVPMWESIDRHALALQRCCTCHRFRYPPGPCCPHCMSMDSTWEPVSGHGTILSWVIFHRQYFDDYPPPYNATAVELEEGPIVVTNLIGREPEGSWIGARVEICYETHDGRTLHRARLRG